MIVFILINNNSCFNPRAREGRDRQATYKAALSGGFNPRAREGRDSATVSDLQFDDGFNPRAREGRDAVGEVREMPLLVFQSTRPRGARHKRNDSTEGRLQSFNPRAREGRDFKIFLIGFVKDKFQSTRPRGARRCQIKALYFKAGFQSTRPRGARHRAGTVSVSPASFNPRAREGRDSRH